MWWKGDGPSVLRFERGRGWWVAGRKKAPPSCVSSKGGVGGWAGREKAPPSRVSSEGGVGG